MFPVDPIFVAACLCAAACAVALVLYSAMALGNIIYATTPDGAREVRAMPVFLRLLLPLAPNLHPVAARPVFAAARKRASADLVSAGFEGAVSGRDFVALRMLSPLAGSVLWGVFVVQAAALVPDDSLFAANAPGIWLFGAVFFALYPGLWLRGAVKKRHTAIFRALPFVLDLLTLSVEAGMDFMSALQRNCAREKRSALNEELMRMSREIQLGTPRRVALRNMAERVREPNLRGVVHALVQADELGVSIGAILRIQSDQLRARRFDHAEKLANEAPVKMLGPLLLFIFPAVFIILLGPVLSQSMHVLFE